MADLNQLIEENRITSQGSLIAYAIDHFSLSVKEIADLTKRCGFESEYMLVDLLIDIEGKGQDVEQAVSAIYNRAAEQEELDLQGRIAKYKSTTNLALLGEFAEAIEESKHRDYIRTRFPKLDEVLSGGLREGLYVFGAIPSLGKTTMVTQIADNVAQQGTTVLFFSLEMARNDIIARSISRLTACAFPELGDYVPFDGKTAMQILDGRRYANYSPRDHRVIELATEEYEKIAGNIRVIEGRGNIGVKEIEREVGDHYEIMQTIPLVVVDYLQLLAPLDVRASDKQNMDRATLELRRIARDYHCPVIVISSFNRSSYNQKVNFGSFKESGAIEYCADVVVGLQLEGVGRDDFDVDVEKAKNPRSIEAVILKNRFGETGGTIRYSYNPALNYFRERREI